MAAVTASATAWTTKVNHIHDKVMHLHIFCAFNANTITFSPSLLDSFSVL